MQGERFAPHTFLVRIWLEQEPDDEDQAVYRGHITYLPDGKPYYFQDVDEIKRFIARWLPSVGGEAP